MFRLLKNWNYMYIKIELNPIFKNNSIKKSFLATRKKNKTTGQIFAHH